MVRHCEPLTHPLPSWTRDAKPPQPVTSSHSLGQKGFPIRRFQPNINRGVDKRKRHLPKDQGIFRGPFHSVRTMSLHIPNTIKYPTPQSPQGSRRVPLTPSVLQVTLGMEPGQGARAQSILTGSVYPVPRSCLRLAELDHGCSIWKLRRK